MRGVAAGVGISALSLVFFVAAEGHAHAAGDVKADVRRAQGCEVCHGLDGLSKVPEAPNLAGQNEQYMVEQLNAFKLGERKSEVMSMVAPTLSPKDVEISPPITRPSRSKWGRFRVNSPIGTVGRGATGRLKWR